MRTFNIVTTCSISVEDVYGRDITVAPKGWEIVDFRPPVNIDFYLAYPQGTTVLALPADPLIDKRPRLIVKRKTFTVFTFRETGEFRSPNKGEKYQIEAGRLPVTASADAGSYGGEKYKIFTLTETQEPAA